MAAKKGMTKREKQREETRRKLHDTAMDLFTRKGFTRVSVEDICEAVGVSKGTFYYYFKSKDQVLVEEFLEIDTFYAGSMEDLSRKFKSPVRRLSEFTIASFRYVNDNMGIKLAKVIYHGEIDPMMGKKTSLGSTKRPFYGMVEQLVMEAQEKGELRGDLDAATIAGFWVRCYRGVIYEWCLQNGRFDLMQAGEEFTRLAVEGLKKR